MGILGRLLAIVVMGAALLALVAVPISVFSAASALDHAPVFWPFAAAVAVTIFIALASPTARIAWGRLCVVAGLAGFALPLEAFVGSIGLNAAIVGQHANQLSAPAAQAGAAIGAGLATVAVSGVAAFVGIFVGLIFVVAGFFTLRGAPRPIGV
jgi:hypothetical protein